MSDEVSFSTFDIAEVLAGRGYPESEVVFYLDEKSAYALAQAEKKMTELQTLGRVEEHAEVEKQAEALKNALREQRFVYHLRGIPNKLRNDLLDEAFAKFPRDTEGMAAMLGQEKPNEKRDDFFTTLLWQAMTVKIVNPKGAVMVNPSREAIQNFRDQAPQATLQVIAQAIGEINNDAKSGFELVAQDPDFLSEP